MADAIVDPRSARWEAGVNAVLGAVAFVLSLLPHPDTIASFGWFAYQPLSGAMYRPTLPLAALDPALWALAVCAAVFVWNIAARRISPAQLLFRPVSARLQPVAGVQVGGTRFAQGVGLALSVAGVVFALLGVPFALVVASALVFAATFLNAAFGVCLGCLLYGAMRRG